MTIDTQFLENYQCCADTFEDATTLNGATFIPSVSDDGTISWTNDKNLHNPSPVNIKGDPGADGRDGYSIDATVSEYDGGHIINLYTVDPDGFAADVKVVNVKNGADGFSPIVESSYLAGEQATQIIITTADEEQTIIIPDGKKPVKGTDYWTEADKAEILAETEEDWQLLCDTTTTEEIINFGIDADMEGNPFSCRKIVAEMILPEPLGKSLQIFFGNATEVWGGNPYVGLNVERDNCKIYDFRIELVKNKFAIFKVDQRILEHFSGSYSSYEMVRTAGVANVSSLTKFFICNLFTENLFPIGTRILVWGCKA